MKRPSSSAVALVLALCAVVLFNTTPPAQAQTAAATTVPRLVRFAGTARDLNGNPLTGVVGITFSLYAEQSGGAPLWLETQNAQADANGRYSVLLGTTKADGLPAELFTSEQARWVGVQVSGQAEQATRSAGERTLCAEGGRCGNRGRTSGFGICPGQFGCGQREQEWRNRCNFDGDR